MKTIVFLTLLTTSVSGFADTPQELLSGFKVKREMMPSGAPGYAQPSSQSGTEGSSRSGEFIAVTSDADKNCFDQAGHESQTNIPLSFIHELRLYENAPPFEMVEKPGKNYSFQFQLKMPEKCFAKLDFAPGRVGKDLALSFRMRDGNATDFVKCVTSAKEEEFVPIRRNYTVGHQHTGHIIWASQYPWVGDLGFMANSPEAQGSSRMSMRSGPNCLAYEPVAPAGMPVFSVAYNEAERLRDICLAAQRGERLGDLKKEIAKEGNAEDLKEILRDILEKSIVDTIGDRIKSQVLAIENQDMMDDFDTDGFKDLLNDFREYILEPQLEQLEKLEKDYRLAGSDKSRQEIREEMEEINRKLIDYDIMFIDDAVRKFNDYGQLRLGEQIHKLKAAAKNFARVNGSRDGKLGVSFATATKGMDGDIQKYRSAEPMRRAVWSTRQGYSTGYSKMYFGLAQKEQGKIQSVWSQYARQQQEWLKHCQRNWIGMMKSPSKCRKGQQNDMRYRQWAMERQQKYQQGIGFYAQRGQFFGELEQMGAENRAARLGPAHSNYSLFGPGQYNYGEESWLATGPGFENDNVAASQMNMMNQQSQFPFPSAFSNGPNPFRAPGTTGSRGPSSWQDPLNHTNGDIYVDNPSYFQGNFDQRYNPGQQSFFGVSP